MVKLKTLKAFYDLHKHENRNPGDVFEVTENRAAILQSMLPDYFEVVDNLEDKTVAELTALAKERGIQYKGRANKATLIKLLSEV